MSWEMQLVTLDHGKFGIQTTIHLSCLVYALDTLPPTNMAPVGGYLENKFDNLGGTPCQASWQWEGG